jgi:uncharacterized protein
MNRLARKYSRLRKIISRYGKLVVAYSGGVDSTLLLCVASDVLGDNVLAVTARSATYPRGEMEHAVKMARKINTRHLVIDSDELSDEKFLRNPVDRCYWCKLSLLGKLKAVARREGIPYVAEASHLTDARDYRPGEKAVREMGSVSPLREAGLDKEDIRRLSRMLGLSCWNKEAMPCLASRFPYGERIEEEKLVRVGEAEIYLKRRGFKNVRVRCEADTARIEVDAAQLGRFFRRAMRRDVVRKLKRLGFMYVSVDLEGYRTGSLNAPLSRQTLRK